MVASSWRGTRQRQKKKAPGSKKSFNFTAPRIRPRIHPRTHVGHWPCLAKKENATQNEQQMTAAMTTTDAPSTMTTSASSVTLNRTMARDASTRTAVLGTHCTSTPACNICKAKGLKLSLSPIDRTCGLTSPSLTAKARKKKSHLVLGRCLHVQRTSAMVRRARRTQNFHTLLIVRVAVRSKKLRILVGEPQLVCTKKIPLL